jgi:hypothetical protein
MRAVACFALAAVALTCLLHTAAAEDLAGSWNTWITPDNFHDDASDVYALNLNVDEAQTDDIAGGALDTGSEDGAASRRRAKHQPHRVLSVGKRIDGVAESSSSGVSGTVALFVGVGVGVMFAAIVAVVVVAASRRTTEAASSTDSAAAPMMV